MPFHVVIEPLSNREKIIIKAPLVRRKQANWGKSCHCKKSSCERNEKLFTALRKKKENVKCCAFKLVINLSFELQRASSKLILTSFIHSICEHTSSATIKRQCRFHCFKSSCFYVWHPLKGNLRVVFVITSGWRKFYVYMSFRDGFSWHMMTKMLFDIIADFNADF